MNTVSVQKLDRYIFFCLCGFASITCINHVIGNQLLGIAVLLGIIRSVKERPNWVIAKPYRNALLVFFGVMFASIFFSPDMVESAKEFWRYANRMTSFLLVLLFVKDTKSLLCIFSLFFFSMFINNIYAIYKGVVLIIQGETYLRVTGFDSMIIMFGTYLLIALPILTVLFFEHKKRRGMQAFIIFVFIAALIMNGTRIIWLVMAFILPLIVFIYVRSIKKIILIILVCIGTAGIIFHTVPFFQDRLVSIADKGNSSNLGHYYIARDSLVLIKENVLLGVGLGRFKQVFDEKYRSEEHKRIEGAPPHAHNNILTIWAETGLFGCLAFCYMFGAFLYFSAKQWLQDRRVSDLMFFLVTLALMLQGITEFSFGLNQAVKIYFCMMAIYLNYQVYEQGKSV